MRCAAPGGLIPYRTGAKFDRIDLTPVTARFLALRRLALKTCACVFIQRSSKKSLNVTNGIKTMNTNVQRIIWLDKVLMITHHGLNSMKKLKDQETPHMLNKILL